MRKTMTNNTQFNNMDFSEQANMTKYLQNIKQFPILSADEEYKLTKSYATNKDRTSANMLISSHLKLVAKIVMSYKGYGLPVNEMISEGNVGLMVALDKFSPDKGVRFSTYAIWWIKAYVQKYILNSWSLVKLGTTQAQKKLFFNLRKIKKQLNLIDDKNMDDNTINKIADMLAVSPSSVKEMNNRMYAHDSSLNVCFDNDSEDGDEYINLVADKTPNQEDIIINSQIIALRKKLFRNAIEFLNVREKDILFKRRLSTTPQTLDELSSIYNISKERVRQIELNSIRKIQKNIPVLQ